VRIFISSAEADSGVQVEGSGQKTENRRNKKAETDNRKPITENSFFILTPLTMG